MTDYAVWGYPELTTGAAPASPSPGPKAPGQLGPDPPKVPRRKWYKIHGGGYQEFILQARPRGHGATYTDVISKPEWVGDPDARQDAITEYIRKFPDQKFRMIRVTTDLDLETIW